MALHKLGRDADARQARERAIELMAASQPEKRPDGRSSSMNWMDRLQAQVVLREVETLLKPAQFKN
jgi:hypothetical protein